MREKPGTPMEQLSWLRLKFMLDNYQNMADAAAKKNCNHQKYLEDLLQGETDLRWDNSINRRITMARFPVVKTMEQFQWNWPSKINRSQIQQLCRLNFINQNAYSNEFGHPFQSYSAICSNLIRPVSPTEFGHPSTCLYEG